MVAYDTIPEFASRLDYELLALGLRLRWLGDGTDRLDWQDVFAVVDHMYSRWSTTEHLLAGVFESIMLLRWELGGRQGPCPKPLPRPGDTSRDTAKSEPVEVEEPVSEGPPLGETDSGVFTGEVMPASEIVDMMGWDFTNQEIAAAYARGEGSYRQLAERFHVSVYRVGKAVRGARAQHTSGGVMRHG